MKRKMRMITICVLLSAVMLCSYLPAHATEENIKISDKEYAVTLSNALNLFISNEKPVSGEVGSKVFLTYTVEKVTKNTSIQSGLIGTMDNTLPYPYVDGHGRMYVKDEEKGSGSILYEEGYTYIFRFERTEEGFQYWCAKMKDDEEEPMLFGGSTAIPPSEAYKYYGTWIGGLEGDVVSATLNHVRCYDEHGNDLGIHMNSPTATRVDDINKLFAVHPVVDSYYSFSLHNTPSVAISNKYPTKSDVIYMEYEVENIKQDDTYQQGLIASCAPKEYYPHGNNKGFLKVKIYEKGQGETPMLREGGKYCICFQRKEDGFDGIVQCTVDGVTEVFTFTGTAGVYDSSYSYFSVWLGEGGDHCVTADFKDVKCYDAEGNSLGIQLNKTEVPISHVGSIEDYSTSLATYYCEKNNVLINLEKDQRFSSVEDGMRIEGDYTIQTETDLYLLNDGKKNHYIYEYLYLTDDEGNVYKRLQDSTVRFVTEEEIIRVVAEAKNGFRVTEPRKPEKKGCTFRGWYLSNGTPFDFETVVTESTTLYAMWEDGAGRTYLATEKMEHSYDLSLLICVGLSVIVAVGCTMGCIIIVRKNKRSKK